MEDKTCKTCIDNDNGFCDRKGILVEDDVSVLIINQIGENP